MKALSRDEARALDRRAIDEFGVPGIVLMENAGRGMAELLLRQGAGGPVVVCCGKGNNGGDGLVIARHLANADAAVHVLLLAQPDRLPDDARVNAEIIRRMADAPRDRRPGPGSLVLEIFPGAIPADHLAELLASAEWVVDALFGSGLRGAVPAPFDQVIAAINASAAQVLAVDIPSGLDSDTGQLLGVAVRAHQTATVAAYKKGFFEPAAAPYLGQVHVIDMGCPRVLLGE